MEMMTVKRKKLKLFPHQKEGLRRVLKEPFYPLFMEQGTGKTPIAIRAIEDRYKKGLIHRVLIFAPNTILYNWELELHKFLNIPKDQFVVERLNHKRKDKRTQAYKEFLKEDLEKYSLKELKALGYKGKKKDILKDHKPKLLILLINYEKSRVMYKELMKYKPHMLIVDESHKLRNRNAQISKNIYKLTRTTKYRVIMTGTPICNGYEDLFMQYKILDEDILGPDYKDFESLYVVKGGYMGHEIVGYQNEDELREIVQDTSYRVRIEECVKLPKLLKKFMFCELNPKARKAYNEMNKEMLTQIDKASQEITRKELKQVCREHGIEYSSKETYASLLLKAAEFINTASCDLVITKVMRLQQIAGGFLTLDTGEVVPLGKDKLNVVKEVVSESNRPLIIFCQYVPEIDMLVGELSKLKRGKRSIRVRSYRNPKERDKVYAEFHKGEVDVLILQLRSGSVGLNLQKANKLIFYSWNFSSDDYVQAIARIKRNGQKRPMEVIHVIAEDTVDMSILDAVKHKRELSDRLLD